MSCWCWTRIAAPALTRERTRWSGLSSATKKTTSPTNQEIMNQKISYVSQKRKQTLVMKQFGINWKERCQPWKQKRLVEWKTIEIFHGKEFLKKGNRNRAFQWGSEDPRTMFLTQCNAWAIHNFTWLESTSHGWSFSSPKSFISSCSPSVPVLICSSTVKLDWFSASRFWIPRACLWTHLLATNQKRKFTGFWNRQIYHQYLWLHTFL